MSSMSLALPCFPAALNTIIAGRTIIRGNLEVKKMPRVDGIVNGRLITNGRLVMSQQARVTADIRCGPAAGRSG